MVGSLRAIVIGTVLATFAAGSLAAITSGCGTPASEPYSEPRIVEPISSVRRASSKSIYFEDGFTGDEKDLASDVMNAIKQKYIITSEIVFVKATGQEISRSYPQLGLFSKDEKSFTDRFGAALYDEHKDKEKDIVEICDIDVFNNKGRDLFESGYVENPGGDDLYKIFIAREIGNILFDKVKTEKLVNTLWKVDVAYEGYRRRAISHFGHPTKESFRLYGRRNMSDKEKWESARAFFIDAFALEVLHYKSLRVKNSDNAFQLKWRYVRKALAKAGYMR